MSTYVELETILYLDKVELSYGDNVILKDVTMIEKDIVRENYTTGQTIAVVGKSGCGKSTLFKAISGLKKPSSGRVLITDESTSKDARDAKIVAVGDVGLVDQHYTLFRHKTVLQTLLYALRWDKHSTKEDKLKNLDEILEEWLLIDQKGQYPNELSGGQRQRVAIIEQILSEHKFFILDEPTSGLDVPGIEMVKQTLAKIRDEHELNTVIFSSHLIEFAVEMADVVYYIGKPAGETYATIIKKFDLKEMGLAWTKYSPGHQAIVDEIKSMMLNE